MNVTTISVMAYPVITIDSSDTEPERDDTPPTPMSSTASTPLIPSDDEEPEEVPDTEASEESETPTHGIPVESTVPEVPRTLPTSHFGGPRTIHTPRKRVRLPRSRSTTAEPTEPAPKKRKAEARRWGWMPDTLRQWATEEGIPSTFEVGETSRVLPLTGEPAERTIPILVARSASQERRINSCVADIETIQEQMEEIETLTGRIQTLEESHYLDDQALGAMHERIRQMEQRTEDMSLRIASAEHWATVANQRAVTAQEQAAAAEEQTQSAMALALVCLTMVAAVLQTSTLSRLER